jgi:hypothetical protein
MSRPLLPLACLLFLAAASRGFAAPQVGIDKLLRIKDLPLLHEGVRVAQSSTFDRTDGNDDRNWWLYQDTNGEYVILDESGPGCVYRIWMTYSMAGFATNRIRVYFDGETAPRIDYRIADFFKGTNAPFLTPLVGDTEVSSGGFYCCVPLPYRQGCKITMTAFPPALERPQHWPADWGYYNITCHRLDSTNGVTTWTGNEDCTPVLDQWRNAGEDPRPETNRLTSSGFVSISPGATGVLADVSGAGCICSITITPTASLTARQLADLQIQMFWDDVQAPAVDIPLGPFFGSAFGETNVTSLLVGMRAQGAYYSFFPMPFWSRALLRVVHTGSAGSASLNYSVTYNTNRYDRARSGSFCAVRRERTLPGDGTDALMLEESGRGHCVGISLAMQAGERPPNRSGLESLEVDERLFVDGSEEPAIHGTGTEDYFNAGWYFSKGVFSLPSHGAPICRLVSGVSSNYCQAYRLHIGDSLPFYNRIRFGFEVLPGAIATGVWTSVAYLYKAAASNGLVLCASFDAGNLAQEAAVGFHSSPEAALITNTWRYPGHDVPVLITATGRVVSGNCEFTVPLCSTNAGVILRRRADASPGGQRATVFVDGISAGTWTAPDTSWTGSISRWKDSEFMIGRGLTSGKTQLTIRIERDPSAAPWNGYAYSVFALQPLDSPQDTDGDGLPDTWEVRNFGYAGAVAGNDDPDLDGAPNAAEYGAGTEPTNAASVLRCRLALESETGEVSFDAVTNRLYDLQTSKNLLLPAWSNRTTGLTGAGPVVVPVADDTPPVFYRIRVHSGN